jgi:hypothetical protein
MNEASASLPGRIASDLRAMLTRDMTPAQIAEAQKLAIEWKPE